jgi:hypothetical protein
MEKCILLRKIVFKKITKSVESFLSQKSFRPVWAGFLTEQTFQSCFVCTGVDAVDLKVECSGKRLMVCWKIWGFWNSYSYKIVLKTLIKFHEATHIVGQLMGCLMEFYTSLTLFYTKMSFKILKFSNRPEQSTFIETGITFLIDIFLALEIRFFVRDTNFLSGSQTKINFFLTIFFSKHSKIKILLCKVDLANLFVCLLQCVPQGRVYLRIILAQYYKSFNNNSFHTIRAPARFEPESTRDPTATHHLDLPGPRYKDSSPQPARPIVRSRCDTWGLIEVVYSKTRLKSLSVI